jgi:nicotinamide-nucleotide amidase
MDTELEQLARLVARRLVETGLVLATAESCTGGWVAQLLTSVPGSSAWFDRGFVTYSNASKEEMLGVSVGTLASHGAVSEETVLEMARGALANSRATISLSVSGIAGPGGGSEEKPVGTVWFAWCLAGGGSVARQELFLGDRQEVRSQAAAEALQGVLNLLG